MTELKFDEDELKYIYTQFREKQDSKDYDKLSIIEQNYINHITYRIAEALEDYQEEPLF